MINRFYLLFNGFNFYRLTLLNKKANDVSIGFNKFVRINFMIAYLVMKDYKLKWTCNFTYIIRKEVY